MTQEDVRLFSAFSRISYVRNSRINLHFPRKIQYVATKLANFSREMCILRHLFAVAHPQKVKKDVLQLQISTKHSQKSILKQNFVIYKLGNNTSKKYDANS